MTTLEQYSPQLAYLMKGYDVFEQACIANSLIQLLAQGTKQDTHN